MCEESRVAHNRRIECLAKVEAMEGAKSARSDEVAEESARRSSKFRLSPLVI